jgi:predicted anti-sigma-YlaC factor YlaD
MSCKSIQARLSSYLDGEASGPEMQSIRSHVNHCRACQNELEGLKSVQMILRGMPTGPEPSNQLPTVISRKIAETKPNYLRLGLALIVPAVLIAVVAYPRPTSNKIQDRDLVIHRQLASDQIFDAGTDSTSGASLVHYSNFEGR